MKTQTTVASELQTINSIVFSELNQRVSEADGVYDLASLQWQLDVLTDFLRWEERNVGGLSCAGLDRVYERYGELIT